MFPFSKAGQSIGSKSKSEEALGGLIILGSIGVIGIVVYSFQATSLVMGTAIASTGIMSAGASALIGGLLGFLFGIPRTLQQERHEEQPPSKQAISLASEKRPTYMANTNLEQISDWLTKILVGVGLTQLAVIPTKLHQITGFIAAGLSTGSNIEGSQTFAFVILMFYLTCGFLFGYLWTRLFLPSAFREADIDKIVAQKVDSKMDEFKKQAEIDANALSFVYHSLNPVTDSPPITQEELNAAIEKAARPVKMQIFYQAQQMRTQNWKNYEDKPKMELTIPIFRALIASDPTDQFHQNHAQLGYALKDKRDPSWAEAAEELTKAIEIKTKLNDLRWPLYELNRAICLIHLDEQFSRKTSSNADAKQKILNDIDEATSYRVLRPVVLSEPSIKEWLELNNIAQKGN